VAAANPNTIVVLNTGDPVVMPWAASAAAILEMWYPGQRGGLATARVLLGEANPGGKLPVTFPADATRLPTFDAHCTPSVISNNPPNDGNCPMYPGVFSAGFVSGLHSYKTIDLVTNGILQGYRWYEQFNVEPLFPFGHGLSYTQFRYSNFAMSQTSDGIDVSFSVRNAGAQTGAEVPQVYLGAPRPAPSGARFAEKQLVGFRRVLLKPGQTARIELRIDRRALSYWSIAQHDWVVAPHARAIFVGSSSRDIRLQALVDVQR
jgi:beta-glucosidase